MLCQYYSCLKSSKYKIFGRMKYQAQMRGPGNDAAASSLFAACATGSMIGEETGFTGMLLASLIGAITLIPVMIAFPIVAELLKNGAGLTQMAVFISALTTVGIITILVEVKYLGRKTAILRNVLAFLFSFITAYLMGVFLK